MNNDREPTKTITLKATCGPGDNLEPVITVMFPDEDCRMKPVVIVAGRRAEHNPDRNRLTIQILFPKQNGGRGDAGEIILINGDVPQIIVQAPEDMEVRHKSG